MFAEVTAVRVPGRILCCNFELARAIGFDVPAWPRMTRTLHQQLVDALSWRVLKPGEDAAGRETITLYADRYGGDGIAPYLGSARAAFTPYGDILLKGIGLTPLFQDHDEDDFRHSHGGYEINESVVEGVQGEIAANLFAREPARLLAIVDQDDYTVFPEKKKPPAPRGVMARVGLQLRPAHVLAESAKQNRHSRHVFVSMTRATGQLVERDGVPDLKATMIRVMDDHADATAEQVRWRVTHGCISTSNMLMSAGALDLGIQSAHPRIVGIDVPQRRRHHERHFFRDYLDRVRQMDMVYRGLGNTLSADERRELHAARIDAPRVMSRAYLRHLDRMFLRAAGLKTTAAERLRALHPDLVRRFTDVMLRFGELKNPGKVPEWTARYDLLAVVDTHQLLRNFPPLFFAHPGGDHGRFIRRELAPIYRGNPYHIRRNRIRVRQLVPAFGRIYRQLMSACADVTDCYGSVEAMRRSIVERAAFENVPLAQAYRPGLYAEVNPAVDRYKESGDPQPLERIIRDRVAASSRNIERLFVATPPRRLGDRSLELNVRFLDGARCSVRAWSDGARRLQVRLQVRRVRDSYVTSLPHDLSLAPAWMDALRFRYGGGEAHGKLRRDEEGRLVVAFDDIQPHEPYGELSGTFAVAGTDIRLGEMRGYVYAMPDAIDLQELMKSATAVRRSAGPAESLRPASQSDTTVPSSRRSASGNSTT